MRKPKNWILLRGLARGTGHWGSFLEKIRAHFPEDKFEFLDLPGNGSRASEASPLEIGEYVRQVRPHSQALQRGEKVHLLAISLGGMVAVEWMREYSHEVEKAYVICTSAGNFSSFNQRFLLPNLPKSLSLAIHQSDEVKWEETLLEMVVNSQECRDAEFLGMVAYSKEHPIQVKNVLRQLVAASRYKFPQQAPGDIKLIGSFGDRLVSPQCTLQIAKQWGLQASMHPWAGHDVPVDDSKWLLEQLT